MTYLWLPVKIKELLPFDIFFLVRQKFVSIIFFVVAQKFVSIILSSKIYVEVSSTVI